jgi:hypothetical protein
MEYKLEVKRIKAQRRSSNMTAEVRTKKLKVKNHGKLEGTKACGMLQVR